MTMRPLPQRREPSLVSKAVGLALAPVIYSMQLSSSLLAWGVKRATATMQLPLRVAITLLQLADALICDLLALLASQPGLRAQVEASQETISGLQLVKQAQERQIALLQSELDSLKMERSKAQRKQLELNQQLQRLQRRVSLQSVDSGAAAAASSYDSPTASAAAAAAGDGKAPFGEQQQFGESAVPAADSPYSSAAFAAYPGKARGGLEAVDAEAYGQVPARGWYLHACVLAAALGVRWWLLNQTDPLQRKVMLVIIWPALWVYGGLVFKCFPNSYTLRASLACTCWALLGYVAHEMVSASVRGRQA